MRINGRRCRLWRAVDQHGYVLDEIVQTRPNTKAARHLLFRLLKKQGLSPKRIVTDKLRSYSAATSGHARYRAPVAQGPQQPGGELSPAVSKAGANPARLPQHWLPQHFVSVFSAIRNLFVPSRSNRSATQIRTHRLNAMAEWKAAALQIA